MQRSGEKDGENKVRVSERIKESENKLQGLHFPLPTFAYKALCVQYAHCNSAGIVFPALQISINRLDQRDQTAFTTTTHIAVLPLLLHTALHLATNDNFKNSKGKDNICISEAKLCIFYLVVKLFHMESKRV